MIDMDKLRVGAEFLEERWPDAKPRMALTLGSGWGAVVESFDQIDELDYDEIPGMGATGVQGHAGRIAWMRAEGGELFIFQGRRHFYEGVGWAPIAMPIFLSKLKGAEICLLTNAAGGIADGLRVGDLMLIEDHINMLGDNPLIGPHDPFWGERFPDQTSVYDSKFIAAAEAAAERVGKLVAKGVYCATSGPTFETPAEVRAFKALGADAVGMSTVPEAILANAAGIRVGAISFITNLASGISPVPLTHAEVMDAASREMPKISELIVELAKDLLR